MKPLFLANAGPAKATERGKRYVCVPNDPLPKEDLDRTVRGLSGREKIPHPVVNPRGMCSFDRNMRLEVVLDAKKGKAKNTATITCPTKVFGRQADEINVYILYKKTPKDEFEELVYEGENVNYSRMCLFILDDAVNTPTFFVSDDRPPVHGDMSPGCILLSQIEDEYTITPLAQWSLIFQEDDELKDNPFLLPTDIPEERREIVENGRGLLALPAPVTPKLASVTQIPNVKVEVWKSYKTGLAENKALALPRAQLILQALAPLRDQDYVNSHVGDFVVAVCPEKDSKDSAIETEGMGVPLDKFFVEKILLNIDLVSQGGSVFVGRVTEEENIALLTAIIDKLPGTSLSMVDKSVLDIPEEELR
jgi:hypothetical protein